MELKIRLITSFFLIIILFFCYFNKIISFIFLNILVFLSMTEFFEVIKKISKKKIVQISIFIISLFYILFFYFTILFYLYYSSDFYLLFFLILICIASDSGGYILGKLIGGKKLSSISPNKTYAGSMGSFVFSLIIAFIFKENINIQHNIYYFTLLMSLLCQIGDLSISYIKRLARIKNTGNILPGHGGILDRVDGILLVLPIGILIILN